MGLLESFVCVIEALCHKLQLCSISTGLPDSQGNRRHSFLDSYTEFVEIEDLSPASTQSCTFLQAFLVLP